MGVQLAQSELDNMQQWQTAGKTPVEIHQRLAASRRRRSKSEPDLTTVRRALEGTTFKRSRVETRGRKKVLSSQNLKALDRARVRLIAKVDSEREVHWDDIIRAGRVPTCDATTAAKNMLKAGFNVKSRHPRMKPTRGEIDEQQRKRICNKWRKLPAKYWAKKVDVIMDNKKWPTPRSAKSQKYVKQLKVRWHLRTPQEGIKKGFTKPHPRKHRTNTGGSINVCAGIINCRVRIWHYLPGSWNSDAACKLYREVVLPALQKYRGNKRRYDILEDNDPTGYKSNDAKKEKARLKIVPVEFPTYSPDLNPCDYALWTEVENRMSMQKARRNESVDAFKLRLRRTAMAIPAPVIEKMLTSMVKRTQSVYDNDGGHIPRD